MPNKSHITLDTVLKTYSEGTVKRTVLDHLSISIEEGELIVLLGRSGSGKSTLLNLISGIDTPDSGQILLGDKDLAKLSEKERTLYRRKEIGFIFQSFNLIPTLTVLENVLLPLQLKGRSDDAMLDSAQFFLKEVGLENRKNSFPDRLSGGEQQRVAIARALAHEPMLILADEPTGNLDFETGKIILTMLNDLVRKNGRTILLATHDRDICSIADRVIELQKGKIVQLSMEEVASR